MMMLKLFLSPTTQMSSKSCISDGDEDLEAQLSPSTAADNPCRNRWRGIFLKLQAHQIFISILRDPRRSISLADISSASSYTLVRSSHCHSSRLSSVITSSCCRSSSLSLPPLHCPFSKLSLDMFISFFLLPNKNGAGSARLNFEWLYTIVLLCCV